MTTRFELSEALNEVEMLSGQIEAKLAWVSKSWPKSADSLALFEAKNFVATFPRFRRLTQHLQRLALMLPEPDRDRGQISFVE